MEAGGVKRKKLNPMRQHIRKQMSQLSSLEEHVAIRRVCRRYKLPLAIQRGITAFYMRAVWAACTPEAQLHTEASIDRNYGDCSVITLWHYERCGLCRYVRFGGSGDSDKSSRTQQWWYEAFWGKVRL